MVCVNYLSGVDHGTTDQGASLLTSNPLTSAVGLHTRNRGITCSCCLFFFLEILTLFYFFFLVFSLSDIQRADKLVDCRHEFSMGTYIIACSARHSHLLPS